MIYKTFLFGFVFGNFNAYSEPLVGSAAPVYSGPITLTRTGFSEESSAEVKNPFIFEANLDGSKKYAYRCIVLQKKWESFSVEINSQKTTTKYEEPYVLIRLRARPKGLHQHFYLWDKNENGEVTFHTKDPHIPRDGKFRTLQHEGKTILGKQVIRFEKGKDELSVFLNDDKLVSFPKVDDFEYIEIGTKGLQVRASNLKINGYKY